MLVGDLLVQRFAGWACLNWWFGMVCLRVLDSGFMVAILVFVFSVEVLRGVVLILLGWVTRFLGVTLRCLGLILMPFCLCGWFRWLVWVWVWGFVREYLGRYFCFYGLFCGQWWIVRCDGGGCVWFVCCDIRVILFSFASCCIFVLLLCGMMLVRCVLVCLRSLGCLC